jgi:hypothetical protein
VGNWNWETGSENLSLKTGFGTVEMSNWKWKTGNRKLGWEIGRLKS